MNIALAFQRFMWLLQRGDTVHKKFWKYTVHLKCFIPAAVWKKRWTYYSPSIWPLWSIPLHNCWLPKHKHCKEVCPKVITLHANLYKSDASWKACMHSCVKSVGTKSSLLTVNKHFKIGSLCKRNWKYNTIHFTFLRKLSVLSLSEFYSGVFTQF